MPRTHSTVDAAIRLLELFDADHTEWSLSELAAALNQPTSTVHDQLLTLTASGLLLRVGRGRYQLGWRLLKLASALYGRLPWYSVAHAAMSRVARGTHLLAFLSVIEGTQVMCIARSVQGRDDAEVMGETRFELPAHATASGKLLLALTDQDLPPYPKRFTPQTNTSAAAWAMTAQHICEEGYAQSVDEWAEGTSALAVPICSEDGLLLSALGVSFPSRRLPEKDGILRLLQDTADSLIWEL